MPKNISKTYSRPALIMLLIIISGLLNICLFVWQAKMAEAAQLPRLNSIYDYGDGANCLDQARPEPEQTINYPSAPMPECCLRQNRNFSALVNTANDKSAPAFTSLIISWPEKSYAENNLAYNIHQNIYPPPSALTLASTVIRE